MAKTDWFRWSREILEETILLGQREGQIKDPEFRRVNVDTTVQEKAITFPTDAKLYHKNLPSPVSSVRKPVGQNLAA
nr:hypothetical protein [Leptospira kirschneri]